VPSKWLRWGAGDENIGNLPDPEPAKTSEFISEVFAGSIPATFPIIHDEKHHVGRNPEISEPVPGHEIIKSHASPERAGATPAARTSVWNAHHDVYGRRVQLALEAICQIPAPEGLVAWLADHAPDLYQRLTEELPDRISRAWDTRLPCDEFDALCCELVDTFRVAANLRVVRQ
jgi:hypothetical protein